MAVALLFTPPSMTAEQYDRVIKELEASGADTLPARRFHACFGPAGRVMVFEVWDSVEALENFTAVLLPLLAEQHIEMAPTEPLEIHSLIDGGDAGALRKTVAVLREQAFFRRPVEKLLEKIHTAKEKASEGNTPGTTDTTEP